MISPPQPLQGGLVVLFEGIDGAGKTTQLNLMREALENAGWPVLSTRNLGGTPIGEALREIMLSSLERPPLADLYISLAIQEALLEVIETARAAGKVILLDRSPLSLAAYQIYGTGIDENTGWQYVQQGMSRLRPEISLLYTADIHKAVKRAREHSDQADYFESKPFNYFERVAEGYAAAAKRYDVRIVDAEQSIEFIHRETLELVDKALAEKLKQKQI